MPQIVKMDVFQLVSQYGIVAILFYIFIKDGFSYLKSRDKIESEKNKNKEEKKEYGIYGSELAKMVGELNTKVVANENAIIELRTNHLKHQEDIVEKMDKFEKAFIKIAVHLQIKDIFG